MCTVKEREGVCEWRECKCVIKLCDCAVVCVRERERETVPGIWEIAPARRGSTD